MKTAFELTCQVISLVSIVFNVYLLYVYQCCPLKMISSYKYFFLLTAIQDIIFSLCVLLIVPVIISEDFAFIFISTGPLRTQLHGQLLIMLFCTTFTTSLLLVANSFIYRYLQVCKPHFFQRNMTQRRAFIVALLNSVLLANWCLTIFVAFWPNEAFRKQLSEKVAETTGLDSMECAQLGFSMKNSLTTFSLSLVIEVFVLVLLTATIAAHAAVRINRTLKANAFSKTFQKLHQQMFVLLLLQTACPFALLHGPSFVSFLLLFSGLNSNTATSYTVTILLSFFPLLGPVIIVFFLKDYRDHTLSMFRLFGRKTPLRAMLVSEMRMNPATVLSG